ncbi:hypothetical protein B0H19DRAFT_601637 [Mycena capillaripes]|nr:hypothetical protein B0H19DRAFT_601637 [Mycena capillaripes]
MITGVRCWSDDGQMTAERRSVINLLRHIDSGNFPKPSPSARKGLEFVIMSVPPPLSIARKMGNLQNDGTGGEGPKVLLPIGDTIGREIEITPMTVDEFCAKYDLGNDILHRLNNDKVESDNIGALITAKNLMSPEYGLKLGHVAEVKWALKLFLLSCPGVKEVPLPVTGTTGGKGGGGKKQGGEGVWARVPWLPRRTYNDFAPFPAVKAVRAVKLE